MLRSLLPFLVLCDKPLPGFTLDDCKAVFYDDIDRVITWKVGSSISALAGKPVRLRWVLKAPDVFTPL
jgi:hypothetical protein